MIYTIKQYKDKSFTDKMDLIRFIKSKREELIAIKASEYKTSSTRVISNELIQKAHQPIIEDISGDFIHVKSVINTTNVIDSHRDLHLKGIWNKTVKDNPYSYHLESHIDRFEKVISNKAKSYNETMNFKDLGLNVNMMIEANINEFILERKKNEIMFDAYKNGEVENHSVGMLYVKYSLAIADEDDKKEMDFYNEMKKQAVNPEVADEYGYFWVVSEAKKREGSAVVFGSNSITPTLWVKNYEPNKTNSIKNIEPLENTQKEEPTEVTHDVIKLIKEKNYFH